MKLQETLPRLLRGRIVSILINVDPLRYGTLVIAHRGYTSSKVTPWGTTPKRFSLKYLRNNINSSKEELIHVLPIGPSGRTVLPDKDTLYK